MEKISINGQLLNLLPMGINPKGNTRSFHVYSSSASEVDEAFSNVSTVTHILESGEETEYRDCVEVVLVTNHKDGTYTVEVSVDATGRKVNDLQIYTDSAICELTMVLSMMMGGF